MVSASVLKTKPPCRRGREALQTAVMWGSDWLLPTLGSSQSEHQAQVGSAETLRLGAGVGHEGHGEGAWAWHCSVGSW